MRPGLADGESVERGLGSVEHEEFVGEARAHVERRVRRVPEVGRLGLGALNKGQFVIADIDCLVVSGRQAAFAGAIVLGGGIFADFRYIRAGVMDLSPGRPDTAVTGRSRTTPPRALVPAAVEYGTVDSGDIMVISGS